jgi:hypothetical protein
MGERRLLGSEHHDVPPIWRVVDSTEAVAALGAARAVGDEAMRELDRHLEELDLDG